MKHFIKGYLIKKNNNQTGFTLIEVLLSIILLSIIITSLMSFFTQSAMITEKNNQKLNVSQVSQKIIKLIDLKLSKQVLENDGITVNGIIDNPPYPLDKSAIQHYIEETFSDNYNINAFIKNDTPQKLIQVHLIVEDKNSGEKSETYTYIRR